MECGHLGVTPYHFNRSPFAQYCFDATLTLAYALNQTLTGIYNLYSLCFQVHSRSLHARGCMIIGSACIQ